MGYRDYQAALVGESRKAERDVTIGVVADPARRLRCESDDEAFLTTYFPDLFYGPWNEDRRRILTEIAYRARHGGDKALAAPRGTGKTIIVECRVGVKAIVTGELRFPLICASTGPDSERILANVKSLYETNELLRADYPEVCDPVWALEGANQRCNMQTVAGKRTRMKWSGEFVQFPIVTLAWCPKCYWPEPNRRDGHLECPKCGATYREWKSKASGSVLMTRGLDAAIRGVRVGNLRPDMAIIDDPETAESAKSETQIEKRMRVIEHDIGGLGSSRKRVSRLMTTTLQNMRCLSATYTDPTQKPSWDGERMRLVKRWPDRKDLWERYVEARQQMGEDDKTGRMAHALYLANREEMDSGCIVTDEFRFNGEALPDGTQREVSTIQHVHNEAADKGWDYVFSELQNDPPDETIEAEDRLTAGKVRGSHKEYSGRVAGINRGVVPDGIKALTITVDVQKRGLYFEVVAWFDGRRRHVVDYGLTGDATLADRIGQSEAVRTNLREFAKQLADGPWCSKDAAVPPNLVLVDNSFETQVVNSCVAEFGHPWRAAMGDPHYKHPKEPTQDKRPSRSGDRWYESLQRLDGKAFWQINTDVDYWKHRCHDSWTVRPKAGDDGQRPESAVTLPGDEPREHAEFAEQIVAEEWREEFKEGKAAPKPKWVGVRRDNHYLDCDYMQLVAGSMLGVWRHAHTAAMPKPRMKLSEMQRNKR